MKKIILLAITIIFNANLIAQHCEPDHLFYPGIIATIGNGPNFSIQAGLQGQLSPISFYIGARSLTLNQNKNVSKNYIVEPYGEFDLRLYWSDPLGIHLYISGSERSAGGGIGANLRVNEFMGIRGRIGYDNGIQAHGGLIILIRTN